MTTGFITYQPKGGMCYVCIHRMRNCVNLPFDAMPVIEKEYSCGIKTHIVRCTEFKRIEVKE